MKTPQDTVPFHPYYTAKDGFGAGLALRLASRSLVFFYPNLLGHADNYIPANPLSTPAHIVPEWYFWPFYAILRAFTVDFILPAKLWGVLAMFGSILLLFFLPWLDKSPVRSGSYRPRFRQFFWILVLDIARARLLRRLAGRRAVRDDQPGRDHLLFRPLPDHPPNPLDGGKDAATAQFDLGKRASRRGGGSRAAESRRHAGQSLRGRHDHGSHSRHPGRPRLRRRRRLVAALGRDRLCRRAARGERRASFPRASRAPASYSFDGPFGRFDRQQLQRGFQVYREVCAACHGLNLVAFRNLHDLGYSEAEVRAIADQWQIPTPSVNPETGEPATRKAIPADRIPNPYANETAARAANNNALPPDLSLIVKAREGGAAYIESLLTGYRNPPHELPRENRPGTGLYYNPYFANLNIAMPPPLTADGQVTYADGTAATRQQMAHDVAAFLTWAAEPNLETRHKVGIWMMIFLIFCTILAYLAYQNVWHGPSSRRVRVTGPLDPENQAKSAEAKDEAGVAG